MSDLSIDIAALEKEISALTPEEIQKQLVDLRTKQKVAMKKYHDPVKAKAYRQKKAEAQKAMAARAKGMPATKPGFANLYEQILDEASERADAKLAESEVEASEVGDEETANA